MRGCRRVSRGGRRRRKNSDTRSPSVRFYRTFATELAATRRVLSEILSPSSFVSKLRTWFIRADEGDRIGLERSRVGQYQKPIQQPRRRTFRRV
jgi:hypothetical protein